MDLIFPVDLALSLFSSDEYLLKRENVNLSIKWFLSGRFERSLEPLPSRCVGIYRSTRRQFDYYEWQLENRWFFSTFFESDFGKVVKLSISWGLSNSSISDQKWSLIVRLSDHQSDYGRIHDEMRQISESYCFSPLRKIQITNSKESTWWIN